MGGLSRVITAALAVVLVVSIIGCTSEGSTSDPAAQPPVKVGAILSLTGTYAALGVAEKNAIELEAERINSSGGVAGRMIELVVEDDATDEAKAVAAATRLIEREGVVAIIGATGTGQSMAIRGEIQRAGVPQISLAGGTVVTAEFDELVFQTPWSNTIVVPFVLSAIRDQGATKVALISDTGGYGKDGRAVILEAAAGVGVDIVADETFNPGDADMTAQLTRAKGSAAEAVLIWTAGKEAVTLLKNAESLGMVGEEGLPFFGGSGQARAEFVEGAGSAAEGFVFGTGKSLVPGSWGEGSAQQVAVDEFAQRYEAAHGKKPDIFAGHGYDAVALLSDAISRVDGDVDGATLRDAVEGTSGLLGYGGSFSFTTQDHNGLSEADLALYRIVDGQWVLAE